jgi:hypothetical protein
MYVTSDDYPYVLKVPMSNGTDVDVNSSQWQPTGTDRLPIQKPLRLCFPSFAV